MTDHLIIPALHISDKAMATLLLAARVHPDLTQDQAVLAIYATVATLKDDLIELHQAFTGQRIPIVHQDHSVTWETPPQ